ncbi:putative collagen-binding domain-containing protein [Microbacterium sp. NPDC091313]
MRPWRGAIESLRAADDYVHPLFPHQEDTGVTTVANSRFAREGWHDGFAAQPQWDVEWDVAVLAEYWSSGKPALAYEMPYEEFWTDGRHALSALYEAYLSGMRGYGYGASGLWNDVYSRSGDALDAGTEYELTVDWPIDPVADALSHPHAPASRHVWWHDAAVLETGDQLSLGARGLRALPWRRLTPRWEDAAWADFGSDGRNFLATDEEDLFVAFFADGTTRTGTLRRLDPQAGYVAEWFDPRTGSSERFAFVVASDGSCALPPKPTADDWLLVVERVYAAS